MYVWENFPIWSKFQIPEEVGLREGLIQNNTSQKGLDGVKADPDPLHIWDISQH